VGNKAKLKDLNIVLCGEAGQGIQTVEHLILRILKTSGYHVFATKEYMSRVRGGSNSTTIRVSEVPVDAWSERIDILIPLSTESIKRLKDRITPDTVIIGEKEKIAGEIDCEKNLCLETPFTNIAKSAGAGFYSNIVATGVLSCIFDIDVNILDGFIRKTFASKGEDVVEKDLEALNRGCDIGVSLVKLGKIINIPGNPEIHGDLLLNGNEAISLGAIAGGCNFISSYPMSPSTGVLVYLSQHGEEYGIVVEQVEDEISAVNMALGAWYAGARAMVTTSGGGFDLMTEGVSLAGIMESPLVIHVAQRPGPGTGLPTRTEQGDLNLVLYGGHGEFPRVVYAPGSIEEGFSLTKSSFDVGANYQVPVFILTDQYYVDTFYNIPDLPYTGKPIEKGIVRSGDDYKRYAFTESGISPRAVPGYGDGVVLADSDEHDTEGHITEDLDLRIRMVDKRMKRLEFLAEEAVPPSLIGGDEFDMLVICWGSTKTAVGEAISRLGDRRVSALHFSQLYPISPASLEIISRARSVFALEGNATGQFARLLMMEGGVKFDGKILKFNGLPFSVEEVEARIRELLSR
jgi:2-oxoglutarate ferredoxin oxidoreductase subunit alpha